MENNKVTYTIAYTQQNDNPPSLDLIATDKAGNVDWIDNYGQRRQTPLLKGETPHRFVLGQIELIENRQGVKERRMTKEVSYYLVGKDTTLEGNDRTQNTINREAHSLLQAHEHVVIRDINTGGNISRNQTGAMPLFELIEKSLITQEKVKKNDLITKALGMATDMKDNAPESFIDMCYSYDIRPIEGVAIQTLYNEVHLKILGNPQHFLDTINHKDAKMLTIIKKAQLKSDGESTIIYFSNDFYYFEDEAIGKSDEEIIYFFNKFPRKKDNLLRKLEISADVVVEVISLPEPVKVEVLNEKDKNNIRNTYDYEIKKMKLSFVKLFSKIDKALKKNPENTAEIEKELKAEVEELRLKFLDAGITEERIQDEIGTFVIRK